MKLHMPELAVALLIMTLTAVRGGRAEEPDIFCIAGRIADHIEKLDGYSIRFSPRGADCSAAVIDSSGQTTFETHAYQIGIDKISGKDVNGDGRPDLVLFAQGGPLRYGYTCSFVELGKKPALAQIHNEYGVWFQQGPPLYRDSRRRLQPNGGNASHLSLRPCQPRGDPSTARSNGCW